MEVWEGSLILNDGHSISDIHLGAAGAKQTLPGPKTQLRFLAIVDTSRIPLNLIYGSRLDVWTGAEETESWFSNVLLAPHSQDKEAQWWHTACPESPLGVLAAVDTADKSSDITQVVFLASKGDNAIPCPPTPPQSSQGTHNATAATDKAITLSAFTINPHLAHANLEDATSPPSPKLSDNKTTTIHATFLSDPPYQPSQARKPATTLKRKTISDTFTEADALRKRVRLKPGESVQAASATGPSMPTLQQLKTNALESRNTTPRPISSNGVPLQSRPFSRSSSVSSPAAIVRAVSRSGGDRISEPAKKSALARVQSVADSSSSNKEVPTDAAVTIAIENTNRDVISRLVMAGMRLYGLSQSKTKISQQLQQQRRASLAPTLSVAASPAATTNEQDQQQECHDRLKDEEYKLIYHIIFKGVVFAFRNHISKTSLLPHMETLRRIVDKLLAMYCNDPLAAQNPPLSNTAGGEGSKGGAVEKLTPGGRRAFETPGEEEGDEGDEFPFASSSAALGIGRAGRREDGDGHGSGGVNTILPNSRKRMGNKDGG